MKYSPSRIWVLLGSAAGDNAQVVRLAEAVGLPFARRSLVVRPEFESAKPPVQPSLHLLDLDASDSLEPPWPELVITVGRHLSMAALWVKKQSQGRTKIVLLGRPKGQAETFDLIIAPIEQRVPKRANVYRVGLPMFGIAGARLEAAGLDWGPRLSHLPRPITAMLVGGSSRRHSFDVQTAHRLAAEAGAIRVRDGGSLYVTTSRRTPVAAVEALAEALPKDAILYRWRANDPGNPYLGLLALADQFIVTGDSLSMLVEIARLGKPLAIAPTGAEVSRPAFLEVVWPLIGAVSATAPWRRPRDIGAVHEFLYSGGWAVRLGEPFTTPKQLPPDDTPEAAGRIRALLP